MVMILCNIRDRCYMKKGIIKGVQKIEDDKSYIPDETLVAFIQEWLQIHKKKEQFTKEGKELSLEDKKKLRESDRMKVYILDNIIFPAFANLTYFFEAMAASSRMSIAFEEEIRELLDPRKSAEAARFGGGGSRLDSIQFRQNNLGRLVMAMLGIHVKNPQNRKPVDDFRIGLMYQVSNIVGDQMDRLLMHEYSGNQIWKSFWNDYSRMQGWFALLARSVKEEPKEYDRKIGFLPIWISNKAAISEMDF